MEKTTTLEVSGTYLEHHGERRGQRVPFSGEVELHNVTKHFRGRLTDCLGESIVHGAFRKNGLCDFSKRYLKRGTSLLYLLERKRIRDCVTEGEFTGCWIAEEDCFGPATCTFTPRADIKPEK